MTVIAELQYGKNSDTVHVYIIVNYIKKVQYIPLKYSSECSHNNTVLRHITFHCIFLLAKCDFEVHSTCCSPKYTQAIIKNTCVWYNEGRTICKISSCFSSIELRAGESCFSVQARYRPRGRTMPNFNLNFL